jgi:hypothetical protein
MWSAVAVQGGILCTNGQWRAKDGLASGTTPFQVFIKDGLVRRDGEGRQCPMKIFMSDLKIKKILHLIFQTQDFKKKARTIFG